MEIIYTRGDLLEADTEVIVNPVNCVGVMGAGVAKQFKSKYPDMFKDYVKHCKTGLMVKHVHMSYQKSTGNIIVNLATKHHFKDDSDLDLIKIQLDSLANVVDTYKFKSIAMPRIGCGLGNLEWEEVEPLIIDAFKDLNVIIKVIDYEKIKIAELAIIENDPIR